MFLVLSALMMRFVMMAPVAVGSPSCRKRWKAKANENQVAQKKLIRTAGALLLLCSLKGHIQLTYSHTHFVLLTNTHIWYMISYCKPMHNSEQSLTLCAEDFRMVPFTTGAALGDGNMALEEPICTLITHN